MSRITLIAALAVGTAGVAAAGLPYYTGLVAERQFNEGFEELKVQNSPYATIRPTGYERGWLSAEAGSELIVRVEDQTYTFPFRHTIAHGMASATVTTLAGLSPEAPEGIRALFGEEWLTAVTKIRPNGDQRTVITAPAREVDADQTHLNWGGVAGTIDLDGDRLVMDVRLPHFRLSADDGHMTVEGMSITGDMNRFSPRLWLGDSRFDVQTFELDAPIEEGASRLAFRLNEVALAQKQSEDGPDLFRFDMGVHVGELTYGQDTSWKDIAWDTEVSNIDRAAYLAFVDELAAAGDPDATPEEFSLQMGQIMLASAEGLLARSPEMRFKRIGATGPYGVFDSALAVGFDGEGQFELSPPDLLARLSVQANARVPKPMMEQILAQTAMTSARAIAEQYPEATEEQIAQVSEQIRQNQKQELESAGLLIAEGDDYTLDASFLRGNLLVNGVPMNGLLGH